MNSFEHPPLPHLLCPIIRCFLLCSEISDRDNGLFIVTRPYSNTERKNFYHHLFPLYWCNNKESGNESSCGVCKSKTVGTTYYFCKSCEEAFHKECVESPPLIKSVHHPKHHLQLFMSQWVRDNKSCAYCDPCGGDSPLGLYYYCSICEFVLDPVCATSPSFLSYHRRHEHILNHFTRKTALICDVCGMVDSKSLIFVCLQCEYVVHKICIYLPFVIRISRHNHRLSFTYSLPRLLSCGVCRQEVNFNYEIYSCTKDCTYVVHANCATRKDVWDGKELEEEPEEEYANLISFQVIGDGIIQHSSHSHRMKFDEKSTDIMYHDKRQCEACGLPLYGGGVYKCMESKCDFVLHEACANLPRIKQHMAHPFPLSLQVSDTKNCFFCEYCDRFSYGFRYVCSKGSRSICIDVRCATISEPFDHQCHPHPLFLSNELGKNRSCSICRKETFQTLNCIECNFFLCFYCATLPYKVRYEHDEHFLTLSYDENASLNWCEICEETLDSNKWHYICSECGVAFHIICILGKCALYWKPAQNLLLDDFSMNIIPNNGLTRPMCDYCERRRKDKLMLELWHDYHNDDDDDADDDLKRKRLFCYRHWEVGNSEDLKSLWENLLD